MPPGFNEACYGGDFTKNLAGAKPVYSATLTLNRSSQPTLRKTLFQLADKHHLKAFDDGANFGGEFFSVYLCSSKGAFMFVDNRAAGENQVHIEVFSYGESWRPEPFLGDLHTALVSQWPKSLRKKNLADSTLGNSIL